MNIPIKPMLLTPHEVFDSDLYMFEPKHDGVRATAYILETTKIFNRNLIEKTHLYPELITPMPLPNGTAIDGEIIAYTDKREDLYQVLKRDLARRPSKSIKVTYVVFDVLMHKHQSTLDLPYHARRKILESLTFSNPNYQICYAYPHGKLLFEAIRQQDREGIVAKLLTSPYQAGTRSTDWLKIKAFRYMDVVVGGFTQKSRPSLAVGIPSEDGLIYMGNVSNGLTERQFAQLSQALSNHISPTNPFTSNITPDHYITPNITLRVKYLDRHHNGRLRQPIIDKITSPY